MDIDSLNIIMTNLIFIDRPFYMCILILLDLTILNLLKKNMTG